MTSSGKGGEDAGFHFELYKKRGGRRKAELHDQKKGTEVIDYVTAGKGGLNRLTSKGERSFLLLTGGRKAGRKVSKGKDGALLARVKQVCREKKKID